MSRLTLTLLAVPDPDYTPSSHRGKIRIEPREVSVPSLAKAIEHYAVFLLDNNLGPGNLAGAGLVRRDGQPLCRIGPNGKLLEVDESGRATGRRFIDPTAPKPRFSHLGALLRYLREDAGLLRRDLADAVGIATATVRNLETGRHIAKAWTWQRLLGHPALADLPRVATEAGLKLPVQNSSGGDGEPGTGGAR